MKRDLLNVERLVFSAKCLLACLFALPSMMPVEAQNVGDAFYIYRNDGGFNAFLRDEVDSIAYSYYDTDSVYYNDVVTQVIYTQDSIYRIPLAAIDSVGFVTPSTIYADDVKELTGELFNYITDVDGMNITFSDNTPTSILPKQGDKIATVELTEIFPCGFFGYVTQVSMTGNGIMLTCDTLQLEDVMFRFYGVAEIVNRNDEKQKLRKSPNKEKQFAFDLPNINVPVDLSGYVTKKKIYDIDGSASIQFNIKPHLKGKVAYVIDNIAFLSYVNVHTVTNLDCIIDVEIAGSSSKDFKKNLLPKSDFLLPWGIPFYVELGPKFEPSGEFAFGTKVYTNITCVQDITYRPLLATMPVANIFANTIANNVKLNSFNLDWQYLAGRVSAKGGVYLRLGIPFGNHKIGWVGGEFDGPIKASADVFIDIDRLKQADKSTVLYDEIKDLLKFDISSYVGVKFVTSVADDKYKFEIGKDFEKTGSWLSGRHLPSFYNIQANRYKGEHGKAEISANISKTILIPLTIGYSLIDNDNNRVNVYYDQKYSFFNSFPSYKMVVDNLYGGRKYKCYPIIKLFGYNMLASPKCDLNPSIEVVTLDASNITESRAQMNGRISEFNPYLDNGECGFFYNTTGDPTYQNSKQVWVGQLSFSFFANGDFAKELTDLEKGTIYYYRTYYYADGEYFYGDVKTFKTEDAQTSCPDSNHPHMIDLGIGTKWACCNVGAHSPEEYGGYYAWGETEEKEVYNWSTYIHCDGSFDTCHNLGSDISGTEYDVAHVQWGAPWCMPTKEEIEKLLNNCNSEWTMENGVYGRRFTSKINGETIFLPAAGGRWSGELLYVGSRGFYWSSTQRPLDSYFAYGLYFYSGDAYWGGGNRSIGLSVRPVIRN